MHSNWPRRLAALAIGIAAHVGSAQAGPYSDLVIFGDSLSDTGNVLSLTQAFTPATPFPVYPAAPGRFSNGPVWTEYLATGLGLPAGAQPANLLWAGGATPLAIGVPGGGNYAYGGARTGLGGVASPTSGLIGQLINWNGAPFATTLTRAADPDALYVLVVGANDLRDARTANAGGTPADQAARQAAAVNTATNVVNAMGLLAQAGARHFLISNLPDLGKTPEADDKGVVAASTDVTLAFNAALAAGAMGFDATFLALFGIDLDIRTIDLYGLGEAVYDDAVNRGGLTYGLTNATTPCLTRGAVSGQYFAPDATATACGSSAHADDLHPSAAFHRLLGQLALSTAMPEPAPLALLALALLALAATRRRARG